ncbi:MAG: ATP-grasp domain-containing protein [Terriglobales bacterium]
MATELGVPHPWTFCPKNLDEVAALECSFPILLKPARRDELNPLTFEKAWVVHDRRELLARYDDAAAMMGPDAVMLQEWIPGNGEHQYAFACLALGGVPLASLTVQRRRQWPIDFGRSSSYVVTVDEPEVESLSRRLLRATGFTGLVEIEFKFDSRDGSYRLLDVNPRIWGWHTLGYAVGIDFPYLLWTLLNGGTVPQLHSSAGVRWVRMLTDLPAAARELVNGATGPLEYLQTLRPPIATAIFAIDDPLPFLAEVPLMIWSRISHKLNTTRLAPAPGATHNPAVSRREKTQSGTGLAA